MKVVYLENDVANDPRFAVDGLVIWRIFDLENLHERNESSVKDAAIIMLRSRKYPTMNSYLVQWNGNS